MVSASPNEFLNKESKINLLELAIKYSFKVLAFKLVDNHYRFFDKKLQKSKGSYGHIAISFRFLDYTFFCSLMKMMKNINITNERGLSMLHIIFSSYKPQEYRTVVRVIELLLSNR